MNNKPKSNRYEYALIVVLFLTWGAVFLDRMTLLYLGPFIAPDLKLTSGQIGLLASALAVTWAIASFAFGNISDRVGRRPILLPAVFLFSILSWVSGAARSFTQLFIIRGVMGLTEGPTWPTIMATISAESPIKVRGRNAGLVQSASGLVGLAAAPILATQIGAHYGWRAAFFVAGIPGLIMGVILWRFMREPARIIEPVKQLGQAVQKIRISQVLSHRNIWLSCLSAIGFMTWLFVSSTFAPLYLTQVAHVSATTTGFILGAGGVGSFLWGFGVPWISDRLGRKNALLLFGLLSAGVPLTALYASHNAALTGLLMFLTWGGNGCAALMLVLIPSESVSPVMAATAIGVPTMIGELFGGTAGPAIAGMVADHAGLSAALWIAAAGAILMGLSALPMKETAPRFVAQEHLIHAGGAELS